MQVKVSYIAALEEYYAADNAFRSVLNKNPIDMYVQIALGLIAIAFIAIGQYVIGGAIAIIAFLWQQGYAKRWIVRRNFNKMVNHGEKETLTFSEENIAYECGLISECIDWDDYAAYLETETLLMLFYNGSDHYMIIPKRAIQNIQEENQLRQLLTRKLANYEVKSV